MSKIFWRSAALAAITMLSIGAANAQTYPASVTGSWTMRANDTLPFTFTVNSQSSDAPCALINGQLSSGDTITGYYCPATGGVSFLRNSASTGATFQVFSGQVSWAGSPSYMTGSFSNFAGGNNTGSYGFTAYTSGQ
jgi:hypothetical protein